MQTLLQRVWATAHCLFTVNLAIIVDILILISHSRVLHREGGQVTKKINS